MSVWIDPPTAPDSGRYRRTAVFFFVVVFGVSVVFEFVVIVIRIVFRVVVFVFTVHAHREFLLLNGLRAMLEHYQDLHNGRKDCW